MSLSVILEFLKAILPTKKIAAWIVGILAAVVALVMGVNASDLKTQYCSTEGVVQLPAMPKAIAAPAPMSVAVPAPAK